MNALPKIVFSQDIFFVLLMMSFFLISLLKGFYWKHAKLLFLGVFAQRYANQFLREENAFTERVKMITFLLMSINFTLVISYVQMMDSLIDLLKIFNLVIIFFLIKVLLIKFFGFVFKIKDLSKLGMFFSLIFDRTLGFLLFPLIVLLYFFSFNISSSVLIVIIIVVCILLFLKLFWLWLIGTNSFGLPQFYIFLYLCAIEILPILMLAKGVFY